MQSEEVRHDGLQSQRPSALIPQHGDQNEEFWCVIIRRAARALRHTMPGDFIPGLKLLRTL